MPNRTNDDVTVDKGTIKRGKYTFPKIFEFVRNVLEVLLRQSEKYCQRQIPER